MDQKDYERAEQAFKEALAVAGNDANPPSQTLWVYNNLVWLYEETGNTEQQKAALLKAAECNRILYERDSTQEASCLDDLAEIARAAGDTAEAHALLERAIAMEAGLPQHDSFSLDYMKEKLDTWKKTDVIPAQ
jgi:tetratricopeptide (TPR) repeat protein